MSTYHCSIKEMTPGLKVLNYLHSFDCSMLSSYHSLLQGNGDITKHATPLSLSAVAAAAAAVTSILVSRLMKKTGEYKEIPVAKGSVPYFGMLIYNSKNNSVLY